MTTGAFLPDFNQWEGNARLIVAAPEMVEVLSWVENMLGYKSDHNELTTDDVRVFRAVKDVLNKARGYKK
jgi:hypothetical protein